MKASEALMTKWESLQEKGDVEKLAKKLELSKGNVSRILNGGESTIERILIIDSFYSKKQKQIEKINASC